jgi:hypothetical protein
MPQLHGFPEVQIVGLLSSVILTGKGRIVSLIPPAVVLLWIVGCASKAPITNASSEEGVMDVAQSELAKAQAVQAMHEAALMGIPGVVGVGIGLSEKGDQASIHVFVDPMSSPRYSPTGIPKQLDGVPVTVVEGGEIKAR